MPPAKNFHDSAKNDPGKAKSGAAARSRFAYQKRARRTARKIKSGRPVRRICDIFLKGNPISRKKNIFLAQFAAGVFQRKTQANCGGGGRRRRIRRILAVSPLGETATAQIENLRRGTWRGSGAPPSTRLSKSFLTSGNRERLPVPDSPRDAQETRAFAADSRGAKASLRRNILFTGV